jgi:hypothetical protein
MGNPLHTRGRAAPALTLALAAAAALGLAACGSVVSTASFKGEEHAVAQRLADFQSDATAGDEGKVCADDLAASVKARLARAGASCDAALKRQLGQIDTVELTVQSVAVKGDSATARVKSTWSGRSLTSSLALVKEGGAWKIAALQ